MLGIAADDPSRRVFLSRSWASTAPVAPTATAAVMVPFPALGAYVRRTCGARSPRLPAFHRTPSVWTSGYNGEMSCQVCPPRSAKSPDLSSKYACAHPKPRSRFRPARLEVDFDFPRRAHLFAEIERGHVQTETRDTRVDREVRVIIEPDDRVLGKHPHRVLVVLHPGVVPYRVDTKETVESHLGFLGRRRRRCLGCDEDGARSAAATRKTTIARAGRPSNLDAASARRVAVFERGQSISESSSLVRAGRGPPEIVYTKVQALMCQCEVGR